MKLFSTLIKISHTKKGKEIPIVVVFLCSFLHQTTSLSIQFTFATAFCIPFVPSSHLSLHAFFIRPFLCYLDDFGFDAVIYNDVLHSLPATKYHCVFVCMCSLTANQHLFIISFHSQNTSSIHYCSIGFSLVSSLIHFFSSHFICCRLLHFIMHTFYPFCLFYSFSSVFVSF